MKLGKSGNLQLQSGWLRVTKNKTFYYQFESNRYSLQVVKLQADYTSRCDHAGIDFFFGIRNLLSIELSLKDNRHWDDEAGTWIGATGCALPPF